MRWRAECWPGSTVPRCWGLTGPNVNCRTGFARCRANTDIEVKVAVVTGGGSGIGRALATALAAAGARVLVGDIDRVRAQQTAEIIPALGHQAFARGIGVSCLCPTGVDTVLLTRLRESPEPDARLAA